MQDVNSIDIFEADLSNTCHVDAAVLLIDLYAREVNGTGQGLQDDVKAALMEMRHDLIPVIPVTSPLANVLLLFRDTTIQTTA